jgi:hypothetical protein
VTARPLIALVGLAVVAGCGAAEQAKQAKTPRLEACPPGVAALGVEDVLPELPPGTQLTESDKKGAAQVTDPLRRQLGDRLRGIRSGVVAKPGRVYGIGVFVLNLNQRVNPRQVIIGAEATARELGAETQPFTIAGQDGVLMPQGGGFVASGVVGECSSVMLMGPDEAQVRAVAKQLQRAG